MWELKLFRLAYVGSDFGRTFHKSTEDALNELCADGWELVTVQEGCAFFKRQKAAEVETEVVEEDGAKHTRGKHRTNSG